MARERLLIDGWELTEGLVRDLELRDGLYGTPEMIGQNPVVANRRGSTYRRKNIGEGSFTINGWVASADGTRTGFESAWQTLLRAVWRPERLVKYERYLASGEIRECYGEVSGQLAPAAIGQQAGRFALQVRVPNGLWRGQTTVTDQSTGTLTSGATFALTNLANGSAPVDDAKVVLTGPLTSPQVAVVGNAVEFVKYTGTIGAGAVVTIDCGTWDVTATGMTANPAAVTYGGDSSYLTIPSPGPTGVAPSVVVTGSGFTASSKVALTGKRAHLI